MMERWNSGAPRVEAEWPFAPTIIDAIVAEHLNQSQGLSGAKLKQKQPLGMSQGSRVAAPWCPLQ